MRARDPGRGMSLSTLLRCEVRFRTATGVPDRRPVLLQGGTPQSHWLEEARRALQRQHGIRGVTPTSIRIPLWPRDIQALEGAA